MQIFHIKNMSRYTHTVKMQQSPLTNNIEHNAVTPTLSSSGGCAGVGTNVTRVDSSSVYYACYSS